MSRERAGSFGAESFYRGETALFRTTWVERHSFPFSFRVADNPSGTSCIACHEWLRGGHPAPSFSHTNRISPTAAPWSAIAGLQRAFNPSVRRPRHGILVPTACLLTWRPASGISNTVRLPTLTRQLSMSRRWKLAIAVVLLVPVLVFAAGIAAIYPLLGPQDGAGVWRGARRVMGRRALSPTAC